MEYETIFDMSTEQLNEEIKESTDLKKFIETHSKELSPISFSDYFNDLITKYLKGKKGEKGWTADYISRVTGISKGAIHKYKESATIGLAENKGLTVTKNRNTLLKLIMIMQGIELNEANKLLQLANYNELYVRNARDAIIMLGIQNKFSYQQYLDAFYEQGDADWLDE